MFNLWASACGKIPGWPMLLEGPCPPWHGSQSSRVSSLRRGAVSNGKGPGMARFLFLFDLFFHEKTWPVRSFSKTDPVRRVVTESKIRWVGLLRWPAAKSFGD